MYMLEIFENYILNYISDHTRYAYLDNLKISKTLLCRFTLFGCWVLLNFLRGGVLGKGIKKKNNQTSKDFGNDAVGVQMPLGD